MNENPNTGAGESDPNRQHDSASASAEGASTPEQLQNEAQQPTAQQPTDDAETRPTPQPAPPQAQPAAPHEPQQSQPAPPTQPAAQQQAQPQQPNPYQQAPAAQDPASHAQQGAQHAGYQQAQHGQPRYGQYAQTPTPPAPQQHVPGSHSLPGASFGPAATPQPDQAWSAPAPAKPKNRRAGVAIAALALVALIGGGAGAGVTALAMSNTAGSSTIGGVEHSNPTTVTVNDSEDVNLVTAVAAQATPSVVTISVSGGQASGSGSGVVISDDGYVLTNNHVVSLDGSVADPSIQVTDSNGNLYDATVVGTDPVYDLAVIRLEGASDLTPIDFADSDALNVGDQTIAIGAPLGLSNTVTDGIVSALNRSISVASSQVPDSGTDDQGESEQQSPYDFWGFDIPGQEETQPSAASSSISLSVIQTDAAINPGNSGGALLDANGDLIGINVAIATAGSGSTGSTAGSIGVGFSIPSNVAQRISSELIANGEASHGLLGATVTDVTSTEQSDTVGALIDDVSAGGAAASAGLRAGDVVTAFDGKPVTSMSDLVAQVRAQAAGASVTITYNRDGQAGESEVTLGSM